jgi:nucleotide-binding universal stress UspA family protein
MLQATTRAETLPILVPIDLSATSNEALLLAAQLAVGSFRSLLILHVAHDDIHQPNIYPRRNEVEQLLPIEEIAEIVLQDFMAEMRKQHPDNAVLANAGLLVVSGLPATRILEVARLTDAGHIVMGGNGRTSLSKLMAGSVSEKVIQKSPVPVTIVHASGKAREGASADVRRSEPRRLLRLVGNPA